MTRQPRTGIAVIVLSYQRPRMLDEALDSVRAARPEQVVLADDGSTFDVAATLRRHRLRNASLVQFAPMSPEQRLTAARVGRLVNTALAGVTTAHVTYLCDDDVLTPEWPAAAAAWLDAHLDAHMVRGEWRVFQDGTAPTRHDPLCALDHRQLTTGNFAHRMSCYWDEGIRWNEDTVAVHDDQFLHDWTAKHGRLDAPSCSVLAGWRRLHPFNMFPVAFPTHYAPSALALLQRSTLE